jgi:hypothetical protein
VRLGEHTVGFLFASHGLIVRFTDRQLESEPTQVAQTTSAALHRREAA